MEFDELKILLKQQLNEHQPQKSADDLSVLLGKKTQSVIGKIKKSLRLELITSIIFLIVFAYFGIAGNFWSLRVYLSVFAVIFFLFFFVLLFLLQKTIKLSSTSLPVKANLQFIVHIIKEYVKRSFQLTMIFIPVSIVFMIILAHNDPSRQIITGNENHLFQNSMQEVIFFIVYIAVFSVGMYFFTKWYLKKLYGNYLNQLEALIKELEE